MSSFNHMNYSNQKNIAKSLARELRKNSTRAERILWKQVRNRNFENLKFYRQHPIFFEYNGLYRFYIADFYCFEKKLVIELDGNSHLGQEEYDTIRTELISMLNIRVLRFRNEEIENNILNVMEHISSVITHPKSLS